MSTRPSSGMRIPVYGSISAYFGPTDEALDSGAYGFAHFNKGVDFAAPDGSPVTNIVAGTVVSVGDSGDGWGYSVKIRLPDGRIVNYGHLRANSSNLKPGQQVQGGEVIGQVGSTGASTGPHLSFDVLAPDGRPLDPSDILGFNASIDNRTGKPWDPSSVNASSWGYSGDSGSQQEQAGVGTGQPYGIGYRQPNEDVLNSLIKQRDAIWKQIEALSSKDDDQSQLALQSLLNEYVAIVQQIDMYRETGYTDSQQAANALATAVQLGQLDLAQAQEAWNRWNSKEASARELAQAQRTSATEFNEAADNLGKSWRTMNYSPGYRQLPADFEDAYERWKAKLNVGEEPGIPKFDISKYIGSPSSSIPQPSSETPQQSITDGWLGRILGPDGNPVLGKKPEPKRTGDLTVPPRNPPVPDGMSLLDKWKYPYKEYRVRAVSDTKDVVEYYHPVWGWLSGDELARKYQKNPFAVQHWRRELRITDPSKSTKKTVNFNGKPITVDWNSDYSKPLSERDQDDDEGFFSKVWGGITKRLPRFEAGGRGIPGGPAIVGEKGQEHIVSPSGDVIPVGQGGPEVAMMPGGVDVLPADIPPEQAFLYAKFKKMMTEDASSSEGRKIAEQQERANDPELQAKVEQAIIKAVASILATNPPRTPTLVGDGWDKDPWADLRPLSGIGPDGMPIAQSSGMPQIQQQPLMQPGIPGVPGGGIPGGTGAGGQP